MSEQVTWLKHDYLAVSQGGWGRAKTLREAVRIARAESFSDKPQTFGYRLSDQTDRVIVDGGLNDFTIITDGGEFKKLGKFEYKTKLKDIPETVEI